MSRTNGTIGLVLTMPGIFNTQADLLKGGDDLLTGLTANSADLGHLVGSRDKLEGTLLQIRDRLAQQGVLTAGKQESSRQVEELCRNGAKLITFLRKGVAEHYGNDSEKLVEFGLQPFRPRARRRPVEPVTPPAVPPVIE